jgi:hypothetical protein
MVAPGPGAGAGVGGAGGGGVGAAGGGGDGGGGGGGGFGEWPQRPEEGTASKARTETRAAALRARPAEPGAIVVWTTVHSKQG